MDTATTLSDRFVRQQDLVPAERLAQLAITVIGVGAIGRQVALQLASIGSRKLQLVDFDVVDATNVTTQGYAAEDVGLPKVQAASAASQPIDGSIELTLVQDRFRPKLTIGEVVFCCVDSIEARASIWRSVEKRTGFFVDGRMLAETIRIVVANDPQGRAHCKRAALRISRAITS